VNRNGSVQDDSMRTEEIARSSTSASASFSALFEWLVDRSQQQRSALLLYTLITRSITFRQSLFVRSDVDQLIVPLLEQMYKEKTEHASHLYVLQVITFMNL
jgi:hypothetical protein